MMFHTFVPNLILHMKMFGCEIFSKYSKQEITNLHFATVMSLEVKKCLEHLSQLIHNIFSPR